MGLIGLTAAVTYLQQFSVNVNAQRALIMLTTFIVAFWEIMRANQFFCVGFGGNDIELHLQYVCINRFLLLLWS